MQEYLKLPLRFGRFFEQKKMPVCTLKESIMYNLHLLITTALEENKQNLDYGSQFWDQEFDIHLSLDARRQVIIETMKKQISSFEKRLAKVLVEVNVKQIEDVSNSGKQLRRRIEIIVSASIAKSNEPFRFQTGFFIGPLGFD